ncbi:MAG: sulfotransferase domain-containing protein [Chloroflexi bacterium]|nr:sulfotransferase domain-containing protein [Chloroflexota bacterium]
MSGLPRSGTSMMMKILEAGGLPVLTDALRTADDDNPKGYYEYERVKQLDKGDVAWLVTAQGKVVKVISALLPHLPATHQYRVIFMQRKLAEVLASQRKMLAHRGEQMGATEDAALATLFEKHLQATKAWLQTQPNIRVLDVDYNQLLLAPTPHLQAVNHFLDDKLDLARMAQAIDPTLHRNRADQ